MDVSPLSPRLLKEITPKLRNGVRSIAGLRQIRGVVALSDDFRAQVDLRNTQLPSES